MPHNDPDPAADFTPIERAFILHQIEAARESARYRAREDLRTALVDSFFADRSSPIANF